MAEYPIPVFHFSVEWGGANGAFSEISGLNKENQVIEYRDGLSKQFSTIKMPGIQKDNNITMKRGVFQGDNDFYDWWSTVSMNTIERRDITISLLNESHEPVMTWKVKRAWPVKVESPSMKADGNEVAVESIELAHEGLTIENS